MEDTSAEAKIRENRARRAAARQGLSLVKSRRRDPRSLDFGGYMLVDIRTDLIVCGFGYNNFGARLEDIEKFLDRNREA